MECIAKEDNGDGSFAIQLATTDAANNSGRENETWSDGDLSPSGTLQFTVHAEAASQFKVGKFYSFAIHPIET